MYAALLLATARRTFRASSATPLTPIASLQYFLPVIDELRLSPPEPAYLHHLRRQVALVAPALVAALDHQTA